MVNHLSIKQKIRKTLERSPQPDNPGDAQPAQPLVQSLKSLFQSYILLKNFEVEFPLSYPKDNGIMQHHDNITGVDIIITSTKRYVPAVSLLLNINIKF